MKLLTTKLLAALAATLLLQSSAHALVKRPHPKPVHHPKVLHRPVVHKPHLPFPRPDLRRFPTPAVSILPTRNPRCRPCPRSVPVRTINRFPLLIAARAALPECAMSATLLSPAKSISVRAASPPPPAGSLPAGAA